MVAPGALRRQNAETGATLGRTGAVLERPRLRPRADGAPSADPPQVRPSLDARAASAGKDLLLLRVRATGGIRIRRTDARKSVQLVDVRLGGPGARYALNAHGLTTAELVVRSAETPRGVVRLERPQVGAFRDSPAMWLGRSARDSVLLDGFTYGALNDTRSADVRKRLYWFERVSNGYSPTFYDQLAAAYQRAGRDEMAETVLVARQHRRYAAAGPAGRIWGAP